MQNKLIIENRKLEKEIKQKDEYLKDLQERNIFLRI